MSLYKNLKVWSLIVRNKIRQFSEYRTNFFIEILVELSYLASQLVFIKVIFNLIPSIYGWNAYMVFFYAIIADLVQTIYWLHGFYLDVDIISGELNMILIRPINEFVFYLSQYASPPMIIYTFVNISAGIIVGTILKLNILNVLLGLAVLIIAYPIYLIPFMFIRTLGFYFGSMNNLDSIYKSLLFSFDRIPHFILKRWAFTLFFAITPAGILSWLYPAAIMLGFFDLTIVLISIPLILALDVALLTLYLKFYKKALRKYEGWGS